jgi:hypothetical protein
MTGKLRSEVSINSRAASTMLVAALMVRTSVAYRSINPVFGGFPTCRVLDPVGTDAEYPLEALCPGHGHMALDRSSVRCLLGSSGLATLTTPGRSNQCPVLTVGSEHAVEAGEFDAGFGYQCGEAGDEIQWLEEQQPHGIPCRRR